MSKEQKEIAEKIRDGSYFEDAREWYARKYLYPVTERTLLVFLAGITGFLFFISTANLKHIIDSSSEPIPVVISVKDSTNQFSIIKPLANDQDTTQEAVARYLIIDYLKTREEYSPKDSEAESLKRNLRKIKRSSSKSVLNQYKDYMSETNKYSPIIRFGNHTTRDIVINNFKFQGDDTSSGKATILFSAETNNHDKQQKSNWNAVIHFRLPDIETIAKTGSPLRFLVKYYHIKPA